MTPSFRMMPDDPPVYFYTVDISEFAVNKMEMRQPVGHKSIVTNVRDFVVNGKGLRLINELQHSIDRK